MASILIIGGAGYIGSRLSKFLEKDCKITIVDTLYYRSQEFNNVIESDYSSLSKEFISSFNVIILLAGQGSVSNSKNLQSVMYNNVYNFQNLVEKLDKSQVFIYASSSSVYGTTGDTQVTENTPFSTPYNYYDMSKQMIDNLVSLSDLHYYGLRFGTVNGYSENLRNDLMINSMVYNGKQNGEIFMTNPDIYRAILGINDLCKAIRCIIENGTYEKRGVYNISSFNATVREIAEKVSSKLAVPITEKVTSFVNFKLQSKAYNFSLDNTKFENVFNFKFKDTIDSIIDELLCNWNNIKNFQNRLKDCYQDYQILDKCLVCNNKVEELLNLNNQPLANSCHTKNQILKKYPLALNLCKNCYHVQLNISVNPDVLFKNYLYVSGTSSTLRSYFLNLARELLEKYDKKEIKILDIACNDASQLDAFKDIGKKLGINVITVGVDPAENLKTLSEGKGHHIICDYFSENVSSNLKNIYESFDIIIAQNVFAHVNYPGKFLEYCKTLMNPESRLYIQTSQAKMIINGEFDTAYHEHLSFFSANSMNELCKRNNLQLESIEYKPIHGTSYLFEIKTGYNQISNNVANFIAEEMAQGLYDPTRYTKYKLEAKMYTNNFGNEIYKYKLQGYNIIGFGCTAKSCVLLNFSGIGHNEIDYIIDENPLKIGLLTPGSDIPIVSKNELLKIDKPTVLVVFAWNFHNEIVSKVKGVLTEEQLKLVKFMKIN